MYVYYLFYFTCESNNFYWYWDVNFNSDSFTCKSIVLLPSLMWEVYFMTPNFHARTICCLHILAINILLIYTSILFSIIFQIYTHDYKYILSKNQQIHLESFIYIYINWVKKTNSVVSYQPSNLILPIIWNGIIISYQHA